MRLRHAAAALLLAACAEAAELGFGANPIRKVVTLLQMMQNKITAEGKLAEDHFDKAMCTCETGGKSLSSSIAEAEGKIPQLEAAIKEAVALHAQLEAEIEKERKDRAEALDVIQKTIASRKQQKNQFEKDKAVLMTNIAALKKAIAALEKGVSGGFLQHGVLLGGFLQTAEARVVRQLSVTVDMGPVDRDMLAAFLAESDSDKYVPQSQEIIGILKQMADEMAEDLKEATDADMASDVSSLSLVSAKKKEVDACALAIESKLERKSEVAVRIAAMQHDLEDTEKGFAEDKKFLSNMDAICAQKRKEWDEYQQTQKAELSALADTIKILNDDDAADLFKKTLPDASASFLQLAASNGRRQALALLGAHRPGRERQRAHSDLVELALRGKKIGFPTIVALIDGIVSALQKEQEDDESKKEWCESQLDTADDSRKELEHDASGIEKAIAEAEEGISQIVGEVEVLASGIRALDEQVAKATEQRKAENEDYVEDLASNNAAEELLGIAKNRLNKFYNPKLYKAPPKRELSEEERITVNMGGTLAPTDPPAGIAGTGVEALVQDAMHAGDQPPPPPTPKPDIIPGTGINSTYVQQVLQMGDDTFQAPTFMQLSSRARAYQAGEDSDTEVEPYKKKSEESAGAIAMIDLLITDLKKQNVEMEATEKDAQADYEEFMKNSAEKRAVDSSAITEKESSKAEYQQELLANKEALKDKTHKIGGTKKYILELHGECDWILKNFELRRSARADEVDSLKKSRAVLQGADYAL